MVKKLITCVFLILLLTNGFSQSKPDTLIEEEAPDCEIIAYNATNLIMYFYAIQDYDSLEIILNDWESTCGISEPILRTRILLSILSNTFNESIYDSTIVDHILNYMMRMDTTVNEDFYYDYQEYFGYVPIRGPYDYFTQCLADTLLQFSFYNPVELLFSEFYANILIDPVKEIQVNADYENTDLRSYYHRRVEKYLSKPDFNINFFTGIWIPFDNAALLGNHPVIGMQGGIRSQKMTYNLTLAFKFIKSKNEYTILREGNLETTTNFFGGYIGADLEREMVRLRKSQIDLLAGIGYDGWDAVKVNTEDDNPDNDLSHSISSLNINFGVGYRHYLRNKTYLALQGKYNFVNYNNQGGTNFSGNTLTFSLLVGGFFNESKTYFLNELRYIE
jgi:hypothetical protein